MGKPSPLLNVKLLDDEGNEVPDGEEGAICVTGLKEAYPPGLFVGYYQDEERTREAVGGAYYNLHDMAWRDSDGYCFFVGRNDDVIKCSGYRIGPFEVESALVDASRPWWSVPSPLRPTPSAARWSRPPSCWRRAGNPPTSWSRSCRTM